MNQQHTQILRDILHRMVARYITVRPLGIDPGEGRKLLPSMDCHILNYGGARTLYRARRPICRSLDAVKAVREPDKYCQSRLGGIDRKHCTPQVRLDLLFGNRPYRLLLAYTSAKNFLLYTGELALRKLEIHRVSTHIRVLNRGSWGEVCFSVRLS